MGVSGYRVCGYCEHRRVVVESASVSRRVLVPRCLVPDAEVEAVDGNFE